MNAENQQQPQFINQNVNLDMYNSNNMPANSLNEASSLHFTSNIPNQIGQTQQYPVNDAVSSKANNSCTKQFNLH